MATKSIQPTPSLFKQVIRILKPWWVSEEKKTAWFGLACIVVFSLLFVWISVLLNDWNRQFFDALERKEMGDFSHLILIFLPIVFSLIAVILTSFWLTQWLSFRWRLWLTMNSQKTWLNNKSYYTIPLVVDGLDNPDQRISSDAQTVPFYAINLFTSLFQNFVTAITFGNILAGLSGRYSLNIFGMSLDLPGLLFWAALIYPLGEIIVTFWVGKSIIDLDVIQEKYEADFRFLLMRIRDRREEIAKYNGKNLKI